MDELYRSDEEAFWRLVKFEAEHESDRLAYYQDLEDAGKARRKRERVAAMRNLPPFPPGSLTIGTVLAKVTRPRKIGAEAYMALCPLHEDDVPSLLIRSNAEYRGEVWLHCFAGCDWKAIRDWLKS